MTDRMFSFDLKPEVRNGVNSMIDQVERFIAGINFYWHHKRWKIEAVRTSVVGVQHSSEQQQKINLSNFYKEALRICYNCRSFKTASCCIHIDSDAIAEIVLLNNYSFLVKIDSTEFSFNIWVISCYNSFSDKKMSHFTKINRFA